MVMRWPPRSGSAAPRPTRMVDLSSVRVGVTETGTWWRLPVLGQHILVAGATGSGKGSVLWSIIAGLAPGVRAGWVRLLVVDPKGGMEFGRGQKLFTGFAHDNGENTLGLLRAVTTVMQQRAQRLRGQTRLHTPTTAEPLIVLIVDEIASLTAYIGDRKIRAEVEQLLGLLLSQGRAVGVSVIAAVQDPSKDVLPIRQLFSIRVGLRMTESTQTSDGPGRRGTGGRRGLRPDPHQHPRCRLRVRGRNAEPVRVRAFHVTDPDIDYLTTHFAPHQPSAGTSGTGNAQPMTFTPVTRHSCGRGGDDSGPAGPSGWHRLHRCGGADGAPRRLTGLRVLVAESRKRRVLRQPDPPDRHRHVRPPASGTVPAATTAARSRARRARICMPATPGSSCTPACTADTTTCPPPSPSTRKCSSP